MTKVKWRWHYPPGCIQADGLETFDANCDDEPEHNKHYAILSQIRGEDVVCDIIQDIIDHGDFDGESFDRVEIVEPKWIAGIYDVEIEYDPRPSVTRLKEPAQPTTETV